MAALIDETIRLHIDMSIDLKQMGFLKHTHARTL